MSRLMIILVLVAAPSGRTEAQTKPSDRAGVKVEFRRAQGEPAPGYKKMKIEWANNTVYVHERADWKLTREDIAEAKVDQDERMKPAVAITFTEAGQEKMGKLSHEQVNKQIAIL